MSCIALLDLRKAEELHFCHSFTGCDVVSTYRGKGNKSAWQTWDMFNEDSDVFARLSQYPQVATVNDKINDW